MASMDVLVELFEEINSVGASWLLPLLSPLPSPSLAVALNFLYYFSLYSFQALSIRCPASLTCSSEQRNTSRRCHTDCHSFSCELHS